MVQINDTKQIINLLEQKLCKKTDGYYHSILSKNWSTIVGNILAECSYPAFFNKNVLVVSITESHYYHQFLLLQDQLKEIINEFFQEQIIDTIELKKTKQIKKQSTRFPHHNYLENQRYRSYDQVIVDIDQIVLTPEEEKEVLSVFDTIDNKYLEYTEKAKKIALNKKKEEKALLEYGYVRCEVCHELFFPHPGTVSYICIKCINQKQTEKLEKMLQLIRTNPLITYDETQKILNAKEALFLRARDILAEDVFYDMLDQTKKNILDAKNNHFIDDKEYEYSLFNQYVKSYMSYKIGSDDEDMYKIIRKNILKKINKFIYFYKKNKLYL